MAIRPSPAPDEADDAATAGEVSPELARALLAFTAEGVYGLDRNGCCTFANQAFLELVGYTAAEVAGANLHDLVHNRRPDGSRYPVEDCPMTHAMRDRRSIRLVEEVLWHKDGTPVPVSYSCAPIVEDGAIEGAVVVVIDVRERRRLEEHERVARLRDELAAAAADRSGEGFGAAAERLLASMCSTLGRDAGGIWLLDGTTLRCAAFWHAPAVPGAALRARSLELELQPGEGLPGRVLERGAPVTVSDFSAETTLPRRAQAHEAGLHTAVAFPIAGGASTIGVVEFFGRDLRTVDDDWLEAVGILGETIGRLLERDAVTAAVAGQQAILRALVDSALDAMILVDERGVVVDFNRAAEATFGHDRAAVLGKPMAELIVPARMRAAHHEAFDRYVSTRVGRLIGTRLELPALRADGSEFLAELTITPVDVGSTRLISGYVRDITERRRREEALRILAATSAALDAATPLAERLAAVAGLLVPALADGCAITVDEDEQLGRIAVAQATSDDVRELVEAAVGRDGAEAELPARGATERSAVTVALTARGRPIGRLVVLPAAGPQGEEFALELGAEIGRRVTVAVEAARALERQRAVAETLQRALLPGVLPSVAGLALAARYVAAQEDTRAGGDWFEVIRLGLGRAGISVGDVVGKGTGAAAVMGQLRSALRAYALEGAPPAEVVARLAAYAERVEGALGTTAAYLVVDALDRTVEFASAGHPAPLRRSGADGGVAPLTGGGGLPLGLGGTYTSGRADLDVDDVLLLYTDGAVEHRERTIDEGIAKLSAGLAAGPAHDVAALCSALMRAVAAEGMRDDVALLAARLTVPLGAPLRLELPAVGPSLAHARAAVTAWLQTLGASADDVTDLVLAVGEGCANAVEHGAGPSGGSFAVTGLATADGVVWLSVRDDGGWRMPEPVRRNDRGRGVRIMSALVDELEFHRLASGTELELRRRLRRDGSGEGASFGEPLAIDDGPGRVEVHGDLDATGVETLERALERAAGETAAVVVDLTRAGTIDSVGVRLLFAAAERATRAGARLRVEVTEGSGVARVLEIVAFDAVAAVDVRPGGDAG